MFLLSQLAWESGIKIVLTGERADEVFGGYGIFKEANLRRFWSRRPDWLRMADVTPAAVPVHEKHSIAAHRRAASVLWSEPADGRPSILLASATV